MIPARSAGLKSVLSRGFSSHSVDGFTGAVGNTPLVRLFLFLSFSSVGSFAFLSSVDSDLFERPLGKDGLQDLWQG